MFIRNIIIGWRNILKNGVASIINIVGLSIGMAVVVLILFWVVDELNYDKFHKNIDRIYSVYEHQQYSDGQELFTNCTPFPLSQELINNYPEVESATTYTDFGYHFIKHGETVQKHGPLFSADNNFLKIFSFDVIDGDINALASNDQVVITDELARIYFGEESAIGKILQINNEHTLTVGAVVATPKENSIINFKMLVPIKLMESFGANFTEWGSNWPSTTILTAKDTDVSNLNSKITNICKEQPNTTLHLFPFKNERLYSYSGKNNRVQYIYQFLGIALIIILIASINFINLSITKAEQRRPEVGVRKVLGAGKYNIMKQFLLEKGIMIILSTFLSVILVGLFLPLFGTLADKNITFAHMQNSYMLLMLLIVLLIVLVSSVAYPSLYLSSVNAVSALKKTVPNKHKSFSLKSLLVVIQFMLSIGLICGSIIISRQIKYVTNYDLGYNHANLIFISLDGDASGKHEAIKQELKGIAGIKNITRSDKLPFWGGNSSWGHDWEGKDPESKILICKMNVDKDYFETLGLKFISGKGLPEAYDVVLNPNDISSPQIILNQEAVKRMGMENPVGKYFSPWGAIKTTIAGVTEDFHFESLHRGVEPMLIMPLLNNPAYIIARVHPENFSQTIDEIKQKWSKILPQSTCEIGFFDDRLAELYQAETKISGLFQYFSFIAIFISCIGLFGLSLFIIERRSKEIGIRKVNGAKISEVIILLNKDFVKWVLMAFIIAVPIAWYLMYQWLKNFAFRTEITWWIFAMAGILALGIALATVSAQSWRAATKNPIESLRYE